MMKRSLFIFKAPPSPLRRAALAQERWFDYAHHERGKGHPECEISCHERNVCCHEYKEGNLERGQNNPFALSEAPLGRSRMGANGAFTLVEILIYLALLIFFTLLTFGFYARVYLVTVRQTQALQAKVRELVAVDLLTRDLQSASRRRQDWDVERCVFVKQEVDDRGAPCDVCVGYQFNDHGLLRREGQYDFTQRAWTDSTAALVATHLRALTFQVVDGGDHVVTGVLVSYQASRGNDGRREQFFVALRNRILP